MDTENLSPTPSQTPLGQPLGMPDDNSVPPTEPTTATEPTTPTEPTAPTEPQPVSDITIEKKKDKPAKKQKGRKGWLIAMLIALVIAGGGAAAYFFIVDKDSHSTKKVKEAVDEDDDEDDDDIYPLDGDDINGTGDGDNVFGTTGEDNTAAEPDNSTDQEPTATPPADDARHGLTLIGDADGYPLTLSLTIDNEQVNGTYKDETTGTTVSVSGQKGNDVFMLTGRAANKTYTFRIVPEGRLYTGTLSQTGGRTLELHLTKQQ